MGLTPEEKRKIYEEEKARIEAREKIEKSKDAEKNKKSYAGIGCLFIAIIIVVIALSFVNSDKTPNVDIGSVAKLYNPSSWRVWMPIDELTDREFTKALANEDEYKISKMVSEGKILHISNYTKVKIIGFPAIEKVRVRILEGEYLGQEGIVCTGEIKNE